MAYVVGARGTVRVEITAVDNTATPPNCTVRVLNNNNGMVGTAATLPQGLVTVVAQPVAVEDVVECMRDDPPFHEGCLVVVRYVDPEDATRWSPAADGGPLLSSAGWRKHGTYNADGI